MAAAAAMSSRMSGSRENPIGLERGRNGKGSAGPARPVLDAMRDAGVVTARLRRDRLLAIQIGKWEDVMKRLLTVGAGVLLATSVAFAQAITPPAKEPTRRTPLQKTEFPDGHVIYMQLLEAEPGTPVPRHTHPGVETSYVLRASWS
jgi:hypothetical protein